LSCMVVNRTPAIAGFSPQWDKEGDLPWIRQDKVLWYDGARITTNALWHAVRDGLKTHRVSKD